MKSRFCQRTDSFLQEAAVMWQNRHFVILRGAFLQKLAVIKQCQNHKKNRHLTKKATIILSLSPLLRFQFKIYLKVKNQFSLLELADFCFLLSFAEELELFFAVDFFAETFAELSEVFAFETLETDFATSLDFS